MCRNIRTLFNFAPPATDDEVRAASIQFVRKLSGYSAPSKSNQKAFDRAVEKTLKIARSRLQRRRRRTPFASARGRADRGASAAKQGCAGPYGRGLNWEAELRP